MKKYLFFDFDGTLTTGGGRGIIPEDTIECINLLKYKGHTVCLATGRLQRDTVRVAAPLNIEHIIADGGYSYTEKNKVIFMRPLNMQNARALLKELDEKRIPWAVNDRNEMSILAQESAKGKLIFHKQFEIRYENDIIIDDIDNIYKIHIAVEKDRLDEINFRGFQYLLYYENGVMIEPMEKDEGIMEFAALKNAEDKDIIVFGDGYNDLKMFHENWYCVAMGNAIDKLKEKADFVTKKSFEGGIMYACKTLGLI